MVDQQEESQAPLAQVPAVVDGAAQEPAKEKAFMEGDELDGKISDFGSYAIDISEGGDVAARIEGDYKKDILPWLGLTVTGKISIKADLVDVLLGVAAKSNNSVIRMLGTKLGKRFGK